MNIKNIIKGTCHLNLVDDDDDSEPDQLQQGELNDFEPY